MELISKTLLLERMAYDRDHYIDKLEEYLTGAIGEFYKARLGEKIFEGRNQDVNHWYKEVSKLLNAFEQAYLHKVEGFSDKGKAFEYAKLEIMEIDVERRAIRAMKRDFNVDCVELGYEITEKDTADFWKIVDDTLDDVSITKYLLGMGV